MTDLTLLQLYPDELGVAGDRGNVMAIRVRLEHAGHTVTVVCHTVGADLPHAVDLILVGNGPLSAMRNVHGDLLRVAEKLGSFRASGVPLFAYGSGAELLGNSITLQDGSTLAGLGLLPFHATRVAERTVGYVVIDTPFGQVVGFEDNASMWVLEPSATPLGILEVGGGNGSGQVEGVLDGSAIATQVGGPVLPLNPLLTDAIIAFMASRRGFATETTGVGDSNVDLEQYAARAREVILSNAKHVFSRI